jgi:hypothetical protein
MTKHLAASLSSLLLLAAAGCSAGAPDDGAQTGSTDLSSFDGNRNRTCASGCAVGSVCDDAIHACVAEPAPPVIRFPIAGALTSALPELAWTTASSSTSSAVEICKDALCMQSVALVTGADHAALGASLPRGTYFARAWGTRTEADGHVVAGAVATPARVFRSNGRPVASKIALGWFADFDADGLSDTPTQDNHPAKSSSDRGALTAGGRSTTGALLVPDMDGDGRTELADLEEDGTGKLVLSRLAPDGTILSSSYDVSPQGRLLLLGDVDRDGYFDLGVAQPLADGVRLEVFFGGPGIVAHRKTIDVRMPTENGKPTAYASISALGDIDGDGYPDLALGGTADTTTEQWGATIPRAGIFIQGGADGDRFYVFRGAATQPFTTALAPIKSEGNAGGGLVPVGDVNGDGVMDAIAIDARPTSLGEWEADTSTSNHWNIAGRGLRPGLAFMVFGGATLQKAQWHSPSFWREGPAASWAYGPALINQYGEVQGIRTITGGRAREEYFFAVGVTSAGDLDGDGFADVAFAMSGAQQPAPLSGEQWDAFSDSKYLRDYTPGPLTPGGWTSTWHMFAAFVDVRYGSATGLGETPAQLILSPTLEASPAMAQWVSFPNVVAAHVNGLYVTEGGRAENFNPPYFTKFAGTFAGPPGAAVVVP